MSRQLISDLLRLLPRRARLHAVLLSFESFIAGILEAVVLIVVVQVGVAVTTGDEVNAPEFPLPIASVSAGSILAIGFVSAVLVLCLHLHVAALTASLAATVLHEARARAIAAFADATFDAQARERHGALQETMTTLALQTSTMTTQLCLFAAAVLGLVALIGGALVVDLWVTAFALVLGAVVLVAIRPVVALTKRRSRQFVAANSSFAERTSEWASLALELRVFGVSNRRRDEITAESLEVSDAQRMMRRASRSGAVLYRDLAIILMVAAAAAFNAASDVDVASAGAVLLLIVRSLSYGQQLNQALQQVAELGPSLEAMDRRLGDLEISRERHRLGVDELTSTRLELCDVGYDYDDSVAIDHVELAVERGELVGIMGPSGGGKSTLLQVIMRLRAPTRGQITVGGHEYLDVSDETWSELVALVPQDPHLFEGTVAENIRFFRPDITDDSVFAAARGANVFDEIMALDNGFDSVLGPGGHGLSGGQRQRVTIARALAGNPALLVLDEPTSALDPQSESLVTATLADLGTARATSVIVVSHRIDTLRSCDRVLVMRQGTLQSAGDLDEAVAILDGGP